MNFFSEPEAPSKNVVVKIEQPCLVIVGDPSTTEIDQEVLIELELNWEVHFTKSLFETLEYTTQRPADLVLIDLGQDQEDLLEMVDALTRQASGTPIILMSAPYEVHVALEGIRRGARHHFPRELLQKEPTAVVRLLEETARTAKMQSISSKLLNRNDLQFTLNANRREISPVIERIHHEMVASGHFCPTSAGQFRVAIEEAVLNAMLHGNLEVSSQLRQDGDGPFDQLVAERSRIAPYCQRKVHIMVGISVSETVIDIVDEGPGFDISRVPDPTEDGRVYQIGGRGILLMRAFSTQLQYFGKGNHVRLIKKSTRAHTK
ncbi:MAG: ATP-binding protein [Zavarzinella sp.]